LILLGKVGRLRLLTDLCEELVVPSGVAQEIERGPEGDLAKSWLRHEGARCVQPLSSIEPVIAAWDLGLGESHVLSWAYRHAGFEALLDDRAARICAEALGIPLRGTLGVILLAKKEGHLPQARRALEELREVGWTIDPELVRIGLAEVGEG
jgi:predicted nucleic acid-binding protein